MASEDKKPKAKKKGRRSPNYPGIGIERALGLAETLYDANQRHETPAEGVFKLWNMGSKSSLSQGIFSAVVKYGLLDVIGSGDDRKAKVSDEAFKIIIDKRPDSPDRPRLVREAALKPTAIKKLWDKYGATPPTADTIKYHLLTDGYTESAAEDLIRVYSENIVFAKLGVQSTLPMENPPDGDGDEDGGEGGTEHPPQDPPKREKRKMPATMNPRELTIPLTGDRDALLTIPRPFTSEDLQALEDYVSLIGKRLVTSNQPDEGSDGDDTE